MSITTNLSRRERRLHFINLLLIVIGATLLLGYIMFANYSSPFSSAFARHIKDKIKEGNNYLNTQQVALTLTDSTMSKISSINPNSSQVFMERDVRNAIRDIRLLYDGNRKDPRYVSFVQTAQFLTLFYEDRIILFKKNENTVRFQRELDEC